MVSFAKRPGPLGVCMYATGCVYVYSGPGPFRCMKLHLYTSTPLFLW